ncbi:hypothetical protein PQA73_gp50 [Erwinia phage Pavtok]|uniref:Uncharacterized protein n=1 Tax=Erwinia phage Pavtok TaxID=2267655 RepID=A0A345BM07_9CAUD|nr:hypothetical protein PQA73_gp50 [Erwinia phage Pavtok]AXF51478.1 hypothetical protein PAVTOK_50 [Erwinia phage Pavtok]
MSKDITKRGFFEVCAFLKQTYPDSRLEVGTWEPFSGSGEISFHVIAMKPGHRIVVCSCDLNQPNGGAICARVLHELTTWLVAFVAGGEA